MPARTMAPDADTPPAALTTPLTAQRTRFAPAPTGYLHLGHVANALWVWRLARQTGACVLLRIEDHDRKRCRPAYEAALLDDVEWLGFVADEGPVRQSDDDRPYAEALELLRRDDVVYGCDCSRTTFETWANDHDRRWHGPGCPGGCRERALDGPVLRVALGGGSEAWMDLLVGPCSDEVAADGDVPIRDRDGNWTYAFSVVADDIRQGVDLVVRGRDLLDATAVQIRLAGRLGRAAPATFAHHPLVRDADGRKLSKADRATGIRDLRAAGMSPQEVIDLAAAAAGPRDPGPNEHAASAVSHQG